MRGPNVATEGLSWPATNAPEIMQVLPHTRPKLRVPTEISLLGKGRDHPVDGACSHCHRTPLVGETIFLYGDDAGYNRIHAPEVTYRNTTWVIPDGVGFLTR